MPLRSSKPVHCSHAQCQTTAWSGAKRRVLAQDARRYMRCARMVYLAGIAAMGRTARGAGAPADAQRPGGLLVKGPAHTHHTHE